MAYRNVFMTVNHYTNTSNPHTCRTVIASDSWNHCRKCKKIVSYNIIVKFKWQITQIITTNTKESPTWLVGRASSRVTSSRLSANMRIACSLVRTSTPFICTASSSLTGGSGSICVNQQEHTAASHPAAAIRDGNETDTEPN